jgi:hypothetical protein
VSFVALLVGAVRQDLRACTDARFPRLSSKLAEIFLESGMRTWRVCVCVMMMPPPAAIDRGDHADMMRTAIRMTRW